MALPMASLSFGRKRVLITGCNGNLGQKLIAHLLSLKSCDLILLDKDAHCKVELPTRRTAKAEYHQADLRTIAASWTSKLKGCDVVFHFAGQDLHPAYDWSASCESLDITANVLVQTSLANVKRVVIASSWHVVGGCKDSGEIYLTSDRDNVISADHPACPGTQWFSGFRLIDSTPYGVAKLAEERLAKSLAEANPTSAFVILRLGWCQPGDNLPETLSPVGCQVEEDGTPGEVEGFTNSAWGSGEPLEDQQFLAEWFRNTWLSNHDFCSLCRKCIDARLPMSLKGFFIVNGMSANDGSRWDLQAGKDLLGYTPSDNVSRVRLNSVSGMENGGSNGHGVRGRIGSGVPELQRSQSTSSSAGYSIDDWVMVG